MDKDPQAIEARVEELFARTTALETLQRIILLRVVGNTDHPGVAMADFMNDVIASLARTEQMAAGSRGMSDGRIVARAAEYAQELAYEMAAAKRSIGKVR